MSKILIWETLQKIGGGQEMTLKVADILSQHHDLHFLIPAEGELSMELDKRNIPYTLMGDQSMPKGTKGVKGLIKFFYLTVVAAIKGRKVVNKLQPDILYAPGPAALVWSAMCARRDTKVIWHLHHIFQSGATLKLINFFSASKCVKRIISVSDYVGSQISNAAAQSKKITLYNPISPLSDDVLRKDLRDEFPSLNTEIKIAQIGFITPMKCQHVAVEIVNTLNNRGVDASLAVIGSVRDEDIEYNATLVGTISEYGITDRVVFTGYRTDVMEIVSTFDVVIVPSVEGFSLVAAQAILENVPVMCVDNSGTTEIIKGTSCGMIYSPDSSIDVIADTLLKTAQIDVKSTTKKHPDFLLSECSNDNYCKNIGELFSL